MSARVSRPPEHVRRPDLCAEHGHPGVTYNPWVDRTWCLCGEVVTDGNTIVWPKADLPGGPLCTPNPELHDGPDQPTLPTGYLELMEGR